MVILLADAVRADEGRQPPHVPLEDALVHREARGAGASVGGGGRRGEAGAGAGGGGGRGRGRSQPRRGAVSLRAPPRPGRAQTSPLRVRLPRGTCCRFRGFGSLPCDGACWTPAASSSCFWWHVLGSTSDRQNPTKKKEDLRFDPGAPAEAPSHVDLLGHCHFHVLLQEMRRLRVFRQQGAAAVRAGVPVPGPGALLPLPLPERGPPGAPAERLPVRALLRYSVGLAFHWLLLGQVTPGIRG